MASYAALPGDGETSFSLIQTASDSDNADALVFFLFDLLYLDARRSVRRRYASEMKQNSRKTHSENTRQDPAGTGARAVAATAKAICSPAGDSQAETARGALSCPDERPHPAYPRDFAGSLR
jgi:hypothetical protein